MTTIKVKQLEWTQHDDGSLWANHSFGWYKAFFQRGEGWILSSSGVELGVWKEPSECQHFAQEHFGRMTFASVEIEDEQ